MIDVTAEVGGLEVAASGAIHLSTDRFNAKVNGMDMKIVFLPPNYSGETKFYTEIADDTLILNLQNFYSSLPEGQFEPQVVGVMHGRKLLLAFSVVTVDKDKSARIFSYTFYLGAEK